MSGGHFDYNQYRINDIADKLRVRIAIARTKPSHYGYSDKFLEEMIKGYNMAMETAARIHRIDWVLSGDDGDDTYVEALSEDISKIEFDDPKRDKYWIKQNDDKFYCYECKNEWIELFEEEEIRCPKCKASNTG